jgi:hypothetical protein
MRELHRLPSLNPQDLAAHVPAEWRDAANELLDNNPNRPDHRANIVRILNDLRLRKVWAQFDEFVVQRLESGPIKHAGDPATWRESYRRTLLLFLTTQGGGRRTRTTKQMLVDRQAIGRVIDTLIKALRNDPEAKDIEIEDALHWATWRGGPVREGTPLRHYAGDGNSYELAPKLIQSDALPSLTPVRITDVLEAVARRLRSGHVISIFDPITVEPFVQPGRSLQAHLEHSLNFHLFSLGPLPADIFAPLIEVALGKPKGTIKPAALADRFRKISSPAAKKFSARKRKP